MVIFGDNSNLTTSAAKTDQPTATRPAVGANTAVPPTTSAACVNCSRASIPVRLSSLHLVT